LKNKQKVISKHNQISSSCHKNRPITICSNSPQYKNYDFFSLDLEGDKKDIINREIKFFRDLHKVRPCLMGFYVFQIAEEVIIFILWGIWTYCYWSVFMATWGNLVVMHNFSSIHFSLPTTETLKEHFIKTFFKLDKLTNKLELLILRIISFNCLYIFSVIYLIWLTVSLMGMSFGFGNGLGSTSLMRL
jgi:hypothetical protein